ncbi:VOC family protein [Spirillospora albida]|uniref:VOC family protein n=1 Tax=Spirillospora albida TaxID=58123 RepID=UPI0004BF1BF6|nr:VOC family protein [Spirillospora albida]
MNLSMDIVGLIVTDIEKATAFYRLLGLEFEVDPKYPDHAGCDLPNGLHLMLDTEESHASTAPGWSPTSGGPRSYLSFQTPAPADVDAKYAELTAAGYESSIEPWDAYWGMRLAAVLDPGGNGVYLYAPLPA